MTRTPAALHSLPLSKTQGWTPPAENFSHTCDVLTLVEVMIYKDSWAAEHTHQVRAPISLRRAREPGLRDKSRGLTHSCSQQGKICSGFSSLVSLPDFSAFGFNALLPALQAHTATKAQEWLLLPNIVTGFFFHWVRDF